MSPARLIASAAERVAKVADRLVAHDQIEESTVYPIVGSAQIATVETASLSGCILKEIQSLPPRFLPMK